MADQQPQSQQEEMNVVHARGQELSPGFRFKPSDSEIVSHYLTNKVRNPDFTCTAIGEVDLNTIEPWDLPKEAKWGAKEWYFFFQKDRKYPTGLRVNRATKAGYRKATGKDKEIYDTTQGVLLLVGMKKKLVFYKGRAPKGDKTNWMMHEYRLEGSGRLPNPASAFSSAANSITTMKASASASKGEWVVCRVFHKTTGIKRTTTPAYQVAMADVEIDQNQNNIPHILIPMPLPLPVPMPVPVPMQFPIMPDFAMDLVAPYYPNVGEGMPPMMLPIVPGEIQINGTLFGNPIVVSPQMVICQQMDMGAIVGQMGMRAAVGKMDMGAAACQMAMGAAVAQMDMGAIGVGGFDGATSESGPSSMVSQNDEQGNASEISSMMSVTGPRSATTTIEMDGKWEYKY